MASETIMSICKQMQWEAVALILLCCCLATPGVAQCNPERCGSKNVSFPFWISHSSCGLPGFQIKCLQKENGNSSLFLATYVNLIKTYLEILDLSYAGTLIINSTDLKAISCDSSNEAFVDFKLPADGPITIGSSNKFVVIGCNASGDIDLDGIRVGGCQTACVNQYDPSYCNTYGCCEVGIPATAREINFTGWGKCGFSTILEPGTWHLPEGELGNYTRGHYGIRLQWGISGGNCSTVKGTASYPCAHDAKCLDVANITHACQCLTGFEGSGYIKGTGCKDVNECGRRDLNECVENTQGGVCHNLLGTYNCSCLKHYRGDGFRNGSRCVSKRSNHVVFPAVAGSVSSFVAVSLAASVLVWWLKKRQLKLVEAKYFQQLQQYIASTVGRETLRLFSAKELAKASNNYSNEMILGSGGFGTVFKGILLDGTSVAIKKSKQAFSVEDGHDFLNEVTILSQINHRNIVKLLGCCVQTKFPLLVSEFVPNGTLSEHLQSKEGCLPWVSRLHIAIETAEALAYLHSGASQPIIHRDVKSSNILLNETFSPKVADFGISRLISTSNDTHLTTNIMGTRGYLDPEYFQTYQLTDKSDVYSFGVVLLELITGLEPLSAERTSEDWSLSNLFLSRVDNNRLKEILDSKVLEDDNQQQMEDIGMLARECLHLERRRRPSMKEVVEELLWVRGGARKKRVRERVECDDVVVEQTGISVEASQTSYKFRSHTFPSSVESMSEEPFTALIEMSTRSEQVSSKESVSSLF